MKIVCLRLPFHGRYDELAFLGRQPGFHVQYLRPQDYKGNADVLVLAGSGKTIADLAYLRSNGGQEIVRLHRSLGKFFLGICGGFQMLGCGMYDPGCIQGDTQQAQGFGLLPVDTFFGPTMMQCKTTGRLQCGGGYGGIIQGVEVRSGISVRHPEALSLPSFMHVINREFLPLANPISPAGESLKAPAPLVLRTGEQKVLWAPGSEDSDGCLSDCGNILGTYAHAVFNEERDQNTNGGWNNAAAIKSLCSLLRHTANSKVSL